MAEFIGNMFTDVYGTIDREIGHDMISVGLDPSVFQTAEEKTIRYGTYDNNFNFHFVDISTMSIGRDPSPTGEAPVSKFNISTMSYINGMNDIDFKGEVTAVGTPGNYTDIQITRLDHYEDGYKRGASAVTESISDPEEAMAKLSHMEENSLDDVPTNISEFKDELLALLNCVESKGTYEAADSDGNRKTLEVNVGVDTSLVLENSTQHDMDAPDRRHMPLVSVTDNDGDVSLKVVCDSKNNVIADYSDGTLRAGDEIRPMPLSDYIESKTGFRLDDNSKTQLDSQYDTAIKAYKPEMEFAEERTVLTKADRISMPHGKDMEVGRENVIPLTFFMKRPMIGEMLDSKGKPVLDNDGDEIVRAYNKGEEYTKDEIIDKIYSLGSLSDEQKVLVIDSLKEVKGRWMPDPSSEKGVEAITAMRGSSMVERSSSRIVTENRQAVTTFATQLDRMSGALDRIETTLSQFSTWTAKDVISKNGTPLSPREMVAQAKDPDAAIAKLPANKIQDASDAISFARSFRHEISSLRGEIQDIRNNILVPGTIDGTGIREKITALISRFNEMPQFIRDDMSKDGGGDSYGRIEQKFEEFVKYVESEYGCIYDKDSNLIIKEDSGISIDGRFLVKSEQIEDARQRQTLQDGVESSLSARLSNSNMDTGSAHAELTRKADRAETAIGNIFSRFLEWRSTEQDPINGVKVRHEPVFDLSKDRIRVGEITNSKLLPVDREIATELRRSAPCGDNKKEFSEKNVKDLELNLSVISGIPVEEMREDVSKEAEKYDSSAEGSKVDREEDFIAAANGFSKVWELTGKEGPDKYIVARNMMIDHYKMVPTLPNRTITLKFFEINALLKAKAEGVTIYSRSGDTIRILSDVYGILRTNIIESALTLVIYAAIEKAYGETDYYKEMRDLLFGDNKDDVSKDNNDIKPNGTGVSSEDKTEESTDTDADAEKNAEANVGKEEGQGQEESPEKPKSPFEEAKDTLEETLKEKIETGKAYTLGDDPQVNDAVKDVFNKAPVKRDKQDYLADIVNSLIKSGIVHDGNKSDVLSGLEKASGIKAESIEKAMPIRQKVESGSLEDIKSLINDYIKDGKDSGIKIKDIEGAIEKGTISNPGFVREILSSVDDFRKASPAGTAGEKRFNNIFGKDGVVLSGYTKEEAKDIIKDYLLNNASTKDVSDKLESLKSEVSAGKYKGALVSALKEVTSEMKSFISIFRDAPGKVVFVTSLVMALTPVTVTGTARDSVDARDTRNNIAVTSDFRHEDAKAENREMPDVRYADITLTLDGKEFTLESVPITEEEKSFLDSVGIDIEKIGNEESDNIENNRNDIDNENNAKVTKEEVSEELKNQVTNEDTTESKTDTTRDDAEKAKVTVEEKEEEGKNGIENNEEDDSGKNMVSIDELLGGVENTVLSDTAEQQVETDSSSDVIHQTSETGTENANAGSTADENPAEETDTGTETDEEQADTALPEEDTLSVEEEMSSLKEAGTVKTEEDSTTQQDAAAAKEDLDTKESDQAESPVETTAETTDPTDAVDEMDQSIKEMESAAVERESSVTADTGTEAPGETVENNNDNSQTGQDNEASVEAPSEKANIGDGNEFKDFAEGVQDFFSDLKEVYMTSNLVEFGEVSDKYAEKIAGFLEDENGGKENLIGQICDFARDIVDTINEGGDKANTLSEQFPDTLSNLIETLVPDDAATAVDALRDIVDNDILSQVEKNIAAENNPEVDNAFEKQALETPPSEIAVSADDVKESAADNGLETTNTVPDQVEITEPSAEQNVTIPDMETNNNPDFENPPAPDQTDLDDTLRKAAEARDAASNEPSTVDNNTKENTYDPDDSIDSEDVRRLIM